MTKPLTKNLIVLTVLSITVISCREPTQRAKLFEPTWQSLRRYKVPEWFEDAKFGIFIHWGLYAVPAYGNEWYPRNMYIKDVDDQNITSDDEKDIFAYHRKTWGNQGEFGYKDFIPLFKAEEFDAGEWADLFAKAGARYVVPVAEHHDGFAMYDSAHTKWNSAQMGPKRDILGELAREVRKRGMKLGASSHYAFNWNYYTHRDEYDTNDPHNYGLYNKPHPEGAPASKEFMDHWYARCVDIIDKYQPDILWFDFGIQEKEFEPYRKKIAAYYYNKGLQWGKPVVLQYKYEIFPKGTAVLDLERGKLDTIRDMVWQTDTSVSYKSWGYVANDDFKTVDSLVDDLVDIVSKNGCLLLNIGPKADGTIPKKARKVLLGIGQWLDLNGQAIYHTRPWRIYGEGPTKIVAGDMGEAETGRITHTGEDIRFTTNGNILYAISLDWPGERLSVKSLGKDKAPDIRIKSVKLLGMGQSLPWARGDEALTVKLPKKKIGKHAFVFKITLAK